MRIAIAAASAFLLLAGSALAADTHRIVVEGVLDGLVQIDQVAIDELRF